MIANRPLFELGRYAAILLAIIFALIPIAWMTSMAFKSVSEWNVGGDELTWLPQNPTFGTFELIFTGVSQEFLDCCSYQLDKTATRPLIASLIAAGLGTLISTIIGTLSSYAVSRFGVFKAVGLTVLQLRLFPPIAVIVPMMVFWTYLDLIDTWFGLALIYGIVSLPFSFWLMKTFFDEVPNGIEEAAMVEGCSRWRVFYRVTLPMVKAPLATSALFVFILNWSDFALALFLTTKNWVTLPVFMNGLSSPATGQMYGAKAAMGLIAAIPPIIFGLLIQRHLVRGLTFGAIKQ